jgi:hypothetical protein
MIKGTTPQHTFSLPFGTEMIKTVEITYAQNGEVIMTKNNDDCNFDGNTVSVKLTQEDTFKFAEGACVGIQIRVLTERDDVLASRVMRVHCDECLSKDVLQ